MIRTIPSELAARAARVRFLATAGGPVRVEDDGVPQPLPIGFVDGACAAQTAQAMLAVLVGSDRAARDDLCERVQAHLASELPTSSDWELAGSDVLQVFLECECGLR